jgi:hypothetical protein
MRGGPVASGTRRKESANSRRAFGEWLVADITTDVIAPNRRTRLPKGSTGTNRHLELLRALFNGATSSKRKLAADNPFLDGTT